MPLVAWLSVVGAEGPPWQDLLARGLATEGFVPGENMRLETIYVPNTPAAIAEGAGAIVALQPDVIVTGGIERVRAVLAETTSIPVIFNNVGEPRGLGLVNDLQSPEGNATGFWVGERPVAQRIQTLEALMPSLDRVVYLYHLGDEPEDRLADYRQAVLAAGYAFQPIGLLDPSETEAALVPFFGEFGTGVLVSSGGRFFADRDTVIRGINTTRMTASYYWTQYAREGGLISVAPDIYDPFRRAGVYVGRVLNGTAIADLPVQAVTKMHLTLNLATARFLGVIISAELREMADELIG